MKKLILSLLVTSLFFSSCSDDDSPECTEITGRSVLHGRPNTYYFRLNGVEVEISEEDYLAYRIGSTYCY